MIEFGVAVVGSGFIGPVHVEGQRRAGQYVVGILGSSPERSREAAQSLGLSKAYRDYDELLADADVHAVHIATPNRLHFEQASRALRAGKHVLCEKPLAMDSKQTAELVELAKQSGLAAGVAYNIRFYPLCHEAMFRCSSGQLGRLLHITGSYMQDWLLRETDFNWRVLSSEAGPLRAVADIGTHWLDLAQFVTGQRVAAVLADLHTVHPTRRRPVGGVQTFTTVDPAATTPVAIDTEDCGAVLLRFENGASGSLWVSQVTAGRKNCLRFEIAGSESALAWNSEAPNELWIGERGQPNQSLLRDPALLSKPAAAIANYPGGHNEGFPDTFKQLFKAFYGYIAAGDFAAPAPFPTFADGHHEVLLCEAILKSHQERRWVDVAR